MLRVSKLNLPYTNFNKHMKPYWRYNKDTLNETHAMKEQAFYVDFPPAISRIQVE